MITVDKCSECPFRNDSNYGSYCNAGHFDLYEYEDFPDNCPLLEGNIIVNICENPKIGKKIMDDYSITVPGTSELILGMMIKDLDKDRIFTYKEDDIPPKAANDNG